MVYVCIQILEEGFLEFINNILMIGMIPALFNDEERDAIINTVRNDSAEAGYGIAKLVSYVSYNIKYNNLLLLISIRIMHFTLIV